MAKEIDSLASHIKDSIENNNQPTPVAKEERSFMDAEACYQSKRGALMGFDFVWSR